MLTFWEPTNQYIEAARTKAADGLTLAEIGDLFAGLLVLTVAAARDLALSGREKKQLVLQAIASLYEAIAPAIPLPPWLAPLRPFLSQSIRATVLALASGAIEALLRWLLGTFPLPAADRGSVSPTP